MKRFESCEEYGKILKKEFQEENNENDQRAHEIETNIEMDVDKRNFVNDEETPRGTHYKVVHKVQTGPRKKRRSKSDAQGEAKRRKLERKANRYSLKDGCGTGFRRRTKCRETMTPDER
ncbi:hypothetical protein PoB_002391600 [Plakobranchus ocellatus]|uniref:Uncharacterized protein n=1 Tax=Plakobranchus ocellatus TaxID=259542 RepID=A0AAV3ZNA3_9GAST|nr:hypothetical protein PoB_002391600 [Plakobranchus ocellatus]